MSHRSRFSSTSHRHASPRPPANRSRRVSRDLRPVAAFRQRGLCSGLKVEDFNAPERWHAPRGDWETEFVVQPPGDGFVHAVTVDEVARRIERLPNRFTRGLEIVQFSSMTRKRRLFPCYGMQWGSAVYLYPIEASLEEVYRRPPTPQQLIEARMYGGRWTHDGALWRLVWTLDSIKEFYLNNVLIHEIGHLNDSRNTSSGDRERFANWFAIEYGYRAAT
ncbi:MAG: hypothetical protein ACT4QC_12145 [Planctomycetaceae bacterium]